MKFLFAGALCAVLIFAPRALAQPATPTRAELLLIARDLLQLAGPNGSPSTEENLSPTENLRRQRLAVARNAAALVGVREALQSEIETPMPDASAGWDFIRNNAALREFARQFAQESDVRAADGDAMGAAQSSLDAIELGAQTSSGATIQWLVGSAVSSIGRKYLLKHAPLLNAVQTREVVARWQRIEAARPTLETVLLAQQQTALQDARVTLEDAGTRAQWQADLLKTDDDELNYSHAQLRQLLSLSATQLQTNINALFGEALERARQPYQTARKLDELRGADALTDAEALTLNGARFGYERKNLSSHLGIVALRLRELKLETGHYPETFDAGVDPFSPDSAPLIYKRAGDSYVLYSVGPDGVDNGGAIEKWADGTEAGSRIRADTTGDILAPEL